ncbi:MAG: TonB-dependent receptor [Bacteroidia bacterium]|nr:TonB-dependent receptor [Bacteroidia bacterium]
MKNSYKCRLLFFAVLFFTGLSISFAQKGSISGTILDEKSEPMIGANVIIENTKVGAVTDINGKYTISNIETGKYTLVFSSIGYKKQKQQVDVTAGKTITTDMILKEDILQLDQVVVVGYGTKQKRDITGSIESIKAKEIAERSTGSFEQSMQGRAAGVQITSMNGIAGSPVKVKIRGVSSISAGGEPLYVIDGIPMTNGDFSSGGLGSGTSALSDINPSDIESIDILKDASSAAIYGSRGSNGVVIITTKKGKSGKTKFSASYTTGFVKEANRLKLLSASEQLGLNDQYYREYYSNNDSVESPLAPVFDNFTRAQADSFAALGGTDWIDQVLRLGNFNDFNISASGGNDKTTFYVGGTYHTENGFIKGNSFDRIAGRINVENKATEHLSLGGNIGLTYSTNKRIPTGDAGGLGNAQQCLPYLPVYNPAGQYFFTTVSGYPSNPLWELETRKYTTQSFRSVSNIWGEYQVVKDLKFRSEFGVDFLYMNEDEFNFRNILDANSYSSAWNRRTNVMNWTTNNFFTYSKVLDSIHDFQITVGSSLQSSSTDGAGINGWDFPNDFFTTPNAASATNKTGYYYETGYGFVSNFLRANYKYNERYITSFSIRNDGSSRFGEKHRYGWFPAFSAGWIISDEPFLKDNKYVSHLKFRASYGFTGNANIGDFAYLGVYYPSNGYNGTAAILPGRLDNPNLGWEKSQQLDLTMDYGFLNNRISGAVSYYYKKTTDMLLNISIPSSSGFTSVLKNVGKMQNTGIEISILTRNIVTKNFKWQTDFNIAFNNNKVLDVQGLPPDAFESGQPGEGRVISGYPVGQAYVVQYAGVSQTSQTITEYDGNGNAIGTSNVKPGQALYYDKFGNLMTSSNPYFYDHRIPRGNPNPKFCGGFTNTFTYKNFDFSFLFSYVYGNTLYDDPAKRQMGDWKHIAQRPEMLDAWTPSNTDTDIPAISLSEPSVNSDRFLYDASFLRLRNITLGYKLPAEISRRFKIESMRIFITGTNLWTLTKYPGWDPEVIRNVDPNTQQGNISFAGPSLQTPQARTFGGGIQIEF